MIRTHTLAGSLLVVAVLGSCGDDGTSSATATHTDVASAFTRIDAVLVDATARRATSDAPSNTAPVASLELRRSAFFSYALPPGWRVGEDGQFALTLVAPDERALTVLVGNAGMPPQYPAQQFVEEKLRALGPQNLRVSGGRSAVPAAGFAQAVEFDVSYSIGGVPCRGVAKWHVAPAYDTATMAMTAALSESSQWPSYEHWLPGVAEQVQALDGGAFGARGVMAQNLANSTAYAETVRRHREASQALQREVADARDSSAARRNEEFREALGGVQTWNDPFGAERAYELPTTHSNYWIDRDGNVLGTDDPRADPNVGSTSEWRRMEALRR
jgi:hypothetical protein